MDASRRISATIFYTESKRRDEWYLPFCRLIYMVQMCLLPSAVDLTRQNVSVLFIFVFGLCIFKTQYSITPIDLSVAIP